MPYGIFDSTTNEWNGAIGEIEKSRIDIAIASLDMLQKRWGVVDFVYSLVHRPYI